MLQLKTSVSLDPGNYERNHMRSLSNRGTRICLIALVITAMGCQNQRKFAENRVLLQQSMDNNTERMVSLIEKLEENQQNMNEDIDIPKWSANTQKGSLLKGCTFQKYTGPMCLGKKRLWPDVWGHCMV